MVVKKVTKNITNNNNTYNITTINNYYVSAPEPTTAQGVVVDEQPEEEDLSPNDRASRDSSSRKEMVCTSTQVKKDGSMVGECFVCTKCTSPSTSAPARQ